MRRFLRLGLEDRDLEGDPGGEQGDPRHGRCRAVHHVGEFLPGNPQPVRERPHAAAHQHAVRVVIEEDRESHQVGGELRTARVPGDPRDAVHEALEAPGARDDAHEGEHRRHEDNDLDPEVVCEFVPQVDGEDVAQAQRGGLHDPGMDQGRQQALGMGLGHGACQQALWQPAMNEQRL